MIDLKVFETWEHAWNWPGIDPQSNQEIYQSMSELIAPTTHFMPSTLGGSSIPSLIKYKYIYIYTHPGVQSYPAQVVDSETTNIQQSVRNWVKKGQEGLDLIYLRNLSPENGAWK